MEERIIYDAYHESGHCVIAMLFSDELDIRKVTINKKMISSIDPTYNGGLGFGWKIKPADTDYNAVDKIALIALAGICSSTIYTKGLEYVNENLEDFPSNTKKHLSSIGADVDYALAKKYINPLAECFNLDPREVQWNEFFYIFKLMLIPEIWNCIINMSTQLIKKEDNTLTFNDIKSLYEEIGFSTYLDSNKDELLLNRYPLNRQKLRF